MDVPADPLRVLSLALASLMRVPVAFSISLAASTCLGGLRNRRVSHFLKEVTGLLKRILGSAFQANEDAALLMDGG